VGLVGYLASLWVIYGFAIDRLPIALPNLLIAPACASGLVLGVVARRRGAADGR